MATIFVNTTPHEIRLRSNAANMAAEPDPTDIVVEPRKGPDGKPAPARVASVPGAEIPGGVGGVAAFEPTTYGEVEGLPAPSPDTVYIVSVVVIGRPEVIGRKDVFMPGTGPKDGAIRTSAGQVYAVTRLIQA